MQQVAIQDANILIDLVKTGLFAHCLALDYEFMTTDLVLDELYTSQQAEIQPHIDSGKFIVIQSSETELTNIRKLSLEDTHLSEQDWSTLYFAEQKKAILLSGDNQLRKVAESRKLIVHGVLWILDSLFQFKLLTAQDCCRFLTSLVSQNRRLPWKECDERKKRWCLPE